MSRYDTTDFVNYDDDEYINEEPQGNKRDKLAIVRIRHLQSRIFLCGIR